jgi:hypothetical protein
MDIAELRESIPELVGPQLDRLQQRAVGIGVVGLVLTAAGALLGRDNGLPSVYHSWLYAYVFWLGVTTGSLGLLMLHHVTGGGWGYVIRRFLEAATRLLPLMLVLFVPVVIGMPVLYKLWMHPSPTDVVVQSKAGYLNAPGFIIRTLIYFAIWMVYAYLLNKWGATQDERADPAVETRLNYLGASGLVVFVLTITFMSVDWLMSLTPDWYSSIFGLLVVASQALSTLSLLVVLFAALAGDLPIAREVPKGYFRDLGNLMLACVMLWGYMSFSQYLITYSGNTTEEVSWYVQRRSGGWGIVSLGLVPLHFALPFLVLLTGSAIKRDPKWLARIAGFIILMRFIDLYWWVTPTFRSHLIPSDGPEWMSLLGDLGTPLLIGGIWLWCWAAQLKKVRTVVPLHDPRLEAALEAVEHA